MPLPSMHYEYMERKTAKVSSDFHVRFDNAYYSVDKAFLHKKYLLRHLQPLFVFILLPESSFANGQGQPVKASGQQILIICRTTIKDLPSGMLLTLSRKPSSLARIQRLLFVQSSNPDHMKSRPIVCAWVF